MAEWLIKFSNIFDLLVEGVELEVVSVEGTFDDVVSEIAKYSGKYRWALVARKVKKSKKKWLGLAEEVFEYFESIMILKTCFANELLKERDGNE